MEYSREHNATHCNALYVNANTNAVKICPSYMVKFCAVRYGEIRYDVIQVQLSIIYSINTGK